MTLARRVSFPSSSLGLAVTALFALAACGKATVLPPSQSRPAPQVHLASGRPAHVAVLVMENAEYGEVKDSGAAPYISRLARTYSLATGSYAIGHPSLPNYLALTGGSAFGISSDCTDCSVPGSGLGGQLQSRHVSWKAYMEGLPHRCFTGAGADDYAKKHDPFVYYRSLVRSPGACQKVVPLSALYRDEAHRSLPTFIWIAPNLCHDMHDCDLREGDRFLAGLLPALLRSLGQNGLLFLTWDEGASDSGCCRLARGGHIATIVAGPGARRGARLPTPVDHYSVLQTIEGLLDLRRLGGAACGCTPSLAPLLVSTAGASG
jgi:phosphatidylinositol-3-phosphatase